MKVYVGTLYSGENEYDECLDSIHRQSYTNYEHFIFKNLPNKEAHSTLFSSFIQMANQFEVLIKVDADMVLTNELVFENIVKKMEENKWLDIFSIAVYDFFSDQLIYGLNAYRNSLRWDTENELVFVDYPSGQYTTFADDKILAPAAIHCKNPSRFQAFHYGIHRGVKSIQPKNGSAHWAFLERARNNFQRGKDVRTGLAVLGAEMAYAGKFGIGDLDYTNPHIKDALERFSAWEAARIAREIKTLRLLNWGFLPGNLRRKLLISKVNLK